MKKVSIWLTDAERALLDDLTRKRQTTIVGLIRDLIYRRSDEPDSTSRLAEIERALSELATVVRASMRVPTFVEYRARAYAIADRQKSGETETQYLSRLAREYMRTYGSWPDPTKQSEFGAVSKDFDRAEFDRARFL